MERSVNFLLSGDAHAPYLAVALNTLRRHYTGRVIVWSYPESWDTVRAITADDRLYAENRHWNPTYRGKNSQFAQKQIVMQQIDSEVGIYLDADLIINASLDPLFEMAEESSFVATQFNDWVTNGGTIRKRIEGLVGCSEIDQYVVQRLITEEHPSVNGGVFVCRKDSPILPQWHTATMSVINKFIADEVCLHTFTLQPFSRICVAGGGGWNTSPKYKPAGLANCDVKIWHGHGDSFVRPNKCQFGVDLWFPEYQLCLQDTIGGICKWNEAAVNQNRHLKALLEKYKIGVL